MARVLVVSDGGATAVEVVKGMDTDGDAWTTAVCPVHGDLEGDHSYFEDMVEVAETHVDRQHRSTAARPVDGPGHNRTDLEG